MIAVPNQFRPKIRAEYPVHNKQIFEEYFFEKFDPHNNEGDRKYLPVMWTSYYVNNKYGKDAKALRDLQRFIDSLDKSRKYYTILQYDDGILNDISGLDIVVVGSGGGRIDKSIGLLTAPHPYHFHNSRSIFCSFAGSKTHPIRDKIRTRYSKVFSIASDNMPIQDYCELLSRSLFHLCPRGYGETSFRICEAMQFGAIPVYISDRHIIPYGIDFNEYGVLVSADKVNDLDDVLKSISPSEITIKQKRGKEIYNELFTFSGARKWILENV